ncbi:unnamed protein product [Urochloa humidicola]
MRSSGCTRRRRQAVASAGHAQAGGGGSQGKISGSNDALYGRRLAFRGQLHMGCLMGHLGQALGHQRNNGGKLLVQIYPPDPNR